MTDPEALRAHAERIKTSGVLGRSPLMQRLFDFLLECSIAGKAPKEIEVAVDAFGKGAEFDVSQDAMVRVYIHKLRRKLEEFYAGPGPASRCASAFPRASTASSSKPPRCPPPKRISRSSRTSHRHPRDAAGWCRCSLDRPCSTSLCLPPSSCGRRHRPDDFREVRRTRVVATAEGRPAHLRRGRRLLHLRRDRRLHGGQAARAGVRYQFAAGSREPYEAESGSRGSVHGYGARLSADGERLRLARRDAGAARPRTSACAS